MSMNLPALIRKTRKVSGMTQKDLVIRADLSPQYVNDVERGRRTILSKTALAPSKALGLPDIKAAHTEAKELKQNPAIVNIRSTSVPGTRRE
jgi:transcriptional regulator with XRE-family HTH domain